MDLAEFSIDLDVAVVSPRPETDETIGPEKAAEPMAVGAARWGFVSLVDDQTRQGSLMYQQRLQGSEHLLVGHAGRARCYDLVGGFVERRINDCRKAVRRSDPGFRIVADALLLELEGPAVPNIGADVLFVDQNLVDGAPRPRPTEVRQNATVIQPIGDLCFVLTF